MSEIKISTHKSELHEKVLGCLFGGAVGDALGAPFEGLWSHSIPAKASLLAGYAEYEGYPRGQYTDDTQLTIATVLSVVEQGHIDPADIARQIFQLWRDQAVIGPGGACTIAAFQFFDHGDWRRSGASDGSAGNGTAMRTAALGFLFLRNTELLSARVADISRITHSDSRSIAGGIAITKAAQLLIAQPDLDAIEFCRGIAKAIDHTNHEFAELILKLPDYLSAKLSDALDFIAWAGMRYREFDQPIITPFVVPTVLAALWAVIYYPASWSDAVAAVIGLGGDVDTLGAIVGALMGVKFGLKAIPEHLVDTVVDRELLQNLAERYYYLIELLLYKKS